MPKQGYLGAFYAKVFEKLVEDCEDAWDEEVNENITSTADTEDKKEGSASAKLVPTATVAAETLLATEKIDPALDLRNHRRITLWIKSKLATTSEGDLKLLLDDTAKCPDTPLEVLNIPALVADTWTAVTLILATPANLNAVISIGLKTSKELTTSDEIHIDAVKAISSLTVTDEAVGTGNGTIKEFDLDYPNVDLDSLVVKVNAVVVKDYEVTVKGHITFVTAPGSGLAITANYTYWVVAQAGGFHNWAFSLTGDTAERTDFSTTGWKKFVGILKGWTGSAERFWLDEKWMAEMGNLLIVKFYEDTGDPLERHEGWALITGIDVSAAVDTLIMEPISFQGHGKLSYEFG